MLRAESLSFAYERPVLTDISVSIAAGELVAIIGANGSGKTTLVRLLAGLLRPQHGRVFINDRALDAYPRRELAKTIGYVAQETRVMFPVSAYEFVLQGRFAYGHGIGFESERDLAAARDAMQLTETVEFMARDLNALSGGERQRVFLARALAQQPEYLLLDEPTSNLDISHQVATLKLLHELAHEKGLGIALITHELNLAAEFADRMLLLKAGSVVGYGKTADVFRKEMLERVFDTRLLIDTNPESGAPRVTVSTKIK